MRIWRGKILRPVEQDDGLQCVLVDRENDAIHALAKEVDYDDVSEKITAGFNYEITGFHTKKTHAEYLVVPHRSQIMFNNRTVFKVIPELHPPIPHHWFGLVDYADLPKRLNNDQILTDIIGRVSTIYPSEDITVSSRIATKRNIQIHNIRMEELTVTLWGSLATDLDVTGINNLPAPVVVVFSSTKVRAHVGNGDIYATNGMSTCILINPYMPATEDYRASFNEPLPAVHVFGSESQQSASLSDKDGGEMISIKTLNLKSVTKNKNDTFLIRGKITKMMSRDAWYYMACPKCSKQLVALWLCVHKRVG